MMEVQLGTGIAPQKKQQRVFEKSQTQKNALEWRVAIFKESLKTHSVRLEHSRPNRQWLDRWDPPSTLFTS